MGSSRLEIVNYCTRAQSDPGRIIMLHLSLFQNIVNLHEPRYLYDVTNLSTRSRNLLKPILYLQYNLGIVNCVT